MAVTIDATGSAAFSGTAQVSPVSFTNLTIGAGATAVVFLIGTSNTAPGTETVVWDAVGANQSCTLLGSVNASAGTARFELWGLLNPQSGNKTLTYTWSGAGTPDLAIDGISFKGSITTSIATGFLHFVSAQTTSTSTAAQNVTLTSPTGDWGVSGAASTNAKVASTTQTNLFIASPNVKANFGGSDATGSGGGTVTFGYVPNSTGSTNWALCAIDVAASTAASDGTEVVTVAAEDDFEPEPGLDFTDAGAVQPVFGSPDEITVVAAEDDFEPELGLDLVQDGTPLAVYADTTEIVAVPAEDDFEPEPGLDFVSDGAIQPVFADQAEIVAVAAEDDFEPEIGLDSVEPVIADLVFDADQVVVVEAQDDFEPEAGLDFVADEAIQPVFADTIEITCVLSEELDPDDPGVDFIDPVPDSSVIGVAQVATSVLATLDLLIAINDEGQYDAIADFGAVAAQPDLIESLAAEDTSEDIEGESFVQPKLEDDSVFPVLSQVLSFLDASQIFLDEGLFDPAPDFADEGASIIFLDSDLPDDIDADDPANFIDAYGQFDPPAAAQPDLIESLASDDTTEDIEGEGYFESRLLDDFVPPVGGLTLKIAVPKTSLNWD